MTIFPSAIVIVNNDLTDSVQEKLAHQLMIDEILDGYAFDQAISNDGYYADDIKKANKRIMVVRSFVDMPNREYADVVIFVKAGLAAIEENKFGPHGFTHPVITLTWKKLETYQT